MRFYNALCNSSYIPTARYLDTVRHDITNLCRAESMRRVESPASPEMLTQNEMCPGALSISKKNY